MHFSKHFCILYAFITILVSVSSNNLFWWLRNEPQLVGIPLKDSSEDDFDLSVDSNNDEGGSSEAIFGAIDLESTTANVVTENRGLQERVYSTPTVNAETPNCVCVEYYLCDSNNTIITNGEGGLFDVRLGNIDKCPGVQVCCRVPDTVTPRIPATVSTSAPGGLTPRMPETQTPRVGCGVRGGFASRILNDDGDNSTDFAEFPWMLALLKIVKLQDGRVENNIFQCGASLIHPQVALTAAHCITGHKKSGLKIRAGEWDSQSTSEPVPHQERGITQIIRHADFYSGALYNDIALLVLDEPLQIVVNVQPICLPQQDAVYNGRRCLATGWGINGFGKGSMYQTTLKKVELPIVPHDICQTKLRESRLGNHFRLHQSFICGGGEPGKDTCKGDGGGPLVCFDPKLGTYVQAGIVSWGLGCGSDGVPAVYTNVPKFRKWLDENLSQIGFN